MREEGRIDRSSHRWSHKWRDAVDADCWLIWFLRLASRALQAGGRRAAAGQGEEEGRRRSAAVPRPCVHATGGGLGGGGGAAAIWCRAAPVCACGRLGGEEEGRRRSGVVPCLCVRAALRPAGILAECRASAGGGCSGSQGQGGCR
jgi:hypothetical protein